MAALPSGQSGRLCYIGDVDWKPVVQRIANLDQIILDLTLTDGDGNAETIGTACNTYSTKPLTNNGFKLYPGDKWVNAFRPKVYVGWEGSVTSAHIHYFQLEYVRIIRAEPDKPIVQAVKDANDAILNDPGSEANRIVANSYEKGQHSLIADSDRGWDPFIGLNWGEPKAWMLNDHPYTVRDMFYPLREMEE